jgi:cytochrome c oxidase subunit 2
VNFFTTAYKNATWNLLSDGVLASQTDHIFVFLVVVTGLLAGLALCLIIFMTVRFHHSRTRERRDIPTRSVKLEGVVAGFLLIFFGSVFAWAGTIYYRMYLPPEKTYDIYVVGKQWMWKFYGVDGTARINLLKVPVNQPVRLIMSSEDVIHSLYVPDLHIKQDVLPGRYTSLWFQADHVGRHRIFCTQYCGTSHAEMGGWLEVVEPAELLSNPGLNPAKSAGNNIYARLQCATCHESANLVAPNLNGLYGSVVQLDNGQTAIADDDYFRESILEPNAKVVSGFAPVMPTYRGQISESELVELVRYLKIKKENVP